MLKHVQAVKCSVRFNTCCRWSGVWLLASLLSSGAFSWSSSSCSCCFWFSCSCTLKIHTKPTEFTKLQKDNLALTKPFAQAHYNTIPAKSEWKSMMNPPPHTHTWDHAPVMLMKIWDTLRIGSWLLQSKPITKLYYKSRTYYTQSAGPSNVPLLLHPNLRAPLDSATP